MATADLKAQVKTLRQEVKALQAELKSKQKDWQKTLEVECDQAYEDGYKDALNDQDVLDAAFNAYMDDAAKQFEKCLMAETKHHKKTAKKKSTRKKATRKKTVKKSI